MRLDTFLLSLKSQLITKMNLSDTHKTLIKLFQRSVDAVKPENLIKSNVKLENGNLVIGDKRYDISQKNVCLVGFGKAVLGMAVQCEKILGKQLKMGIISCPLNSNHFQKDSVIKVYEGAENNVPDESSEKATDEIISLVKKLDCGKDHLIVLISGGGSALFAKPKPGISLVEKMEAVSLLMKSGLDINELNTIRKKLSAVKGGGFANLCYPIQTTCLILSDVISDPLDVIASGPTVTNTDSPSSALNIIHKYNLTNKISKNVLTHLENNIDIPVNTEKFSHVDNFLIGSNKIALAECKNYAEELGFETVILSNVVKGNINQVSEFYINLIKLLLISIKSSSEVNIEKFFSECPFELYNSCESSIKNIVRKKKPKICIIGGGEITVKVKGTGKGGRNQELALMMALKLKNLGFLNDFEIMFLSGGTDGCDGPTDAAGAIGCSYITEKSINYGLNIIDFLQNNDSYNFYSKFQNGDFLIKTGPTGTNVMDIHIVILQPKLAP